METLSLKELRKSRKLTLKNLQEISGITVANLSLIENAKSTPTVLTRMRLEAIFGQRIKFVDVADKTVRTLFPITTRTK